MFDTDFESAKILSPLSSRSNESTSTSRYESDILSKADFARLQCLHEEEVTMAILVVEFSSFISSSSSLVNGDGSATTEGEDLLLCFVRRGFLVVKSYLLPVDVKGGGFPEELLRMPLLDLPPPLTLAGPRKKTEQDGEEVLIYVCLSPSSSSSSSYIFFVLTSSLSLCLKLFIPRRIEEQKHFRVLNPT